FDQLGHFIAPTWQALLDGARYVDLRLTEILDELRPDVVVEDNVCAFPAIPASGRPWVRIVSCNPLEVSDRCRRRSPVCPLTTVRAGTASAPSTRVRSASSRRRSRCFASSEARRRFRSWR